MMPAEVPLQHAYGRTLKPAFDLQDGGFTPGWWDTDVRPETARTERFLRWTEEKQEVVRAHLDTDCHIADQYVSISELRTPVIEIPFLEVHADYRLRGFGSQAVRQLAEMYPNRTLAAFSEEADGFWKV